MGSVSSHEASRRALGPSYKSSKASSGPGRQERLKGQDIAPEVRPGKAKFNHFSTGDATTLCTTSCGSSFSGSGDTTSAWGAASQRTSTGPNQSDWESSLTPRAVGGINNAVPHGFRSQKGSSFPTGSAGKPPPEPDKNWGSKSPGVRGLWQALKRGADHGGLKIGDIRNRASYLLPQKGDFEPAESSANALRLHILREEEEHRRRRQSDIPGRVFPAVSAVNVEQPPFPVAHDRLTGPPNAVTLTNAYQGRTPSEKKTPPSTLRPIEGSPFPGGEAHAFAPDAETPLGPPGRRPPRRSVIPPSSHRPGPAPSRWIADGPLDGRWEIERGVWTRQGAQQNQMGLVDDRSKAFATPMQHGQAVAESPSPGPPGLFGLLNPPVRRVAVGPLAARMRQQQQTQLQAGQPVVPMTNRGVAAAATIQLVKRRQTNEERRRYQQRHIASPGASTRAAGTPGTGAGVTLCSSRMQKVPGPESQFERTRGVATAAGLAGVTTAEGRCHRCWPDKGTCGTFVVGNAMQFCPENRNINYVSERDSRLHDVQKEKLQAAQCRCGELSLKSSGSAYEEVVAGCIRGTCDSAGGSDMRGLRGASVPAKRCQNQYSNNLSVQGKSETHHLSSWARSTSCAPQTASRAQQRNAFVAKPRTHVGAPNRRAR